MPEYRITYDTQVSVSVTVELTDDDEAMDEETSVRVVSEHFESAGFVFGAREYSVVCDASIDGQGPSRIVRLGGDGGEAAVLREDELVGEVS